MQKYANVFNNMQKACKACKSVRKHVNYTKMFISTQEKCKISTRMKNFAKGSKSMKKCPKVGKSMQYNENLCRSV